MGLQAILQVISSGSNLTCQIILIGHCQFSISFQFFEFSLNLAFPFCEERYEVAVHYKGKAIPVTGREDP
jgi:hypothetical protein